MPFFCWLKPGGSISKNGKLMDHVCFLYQALFILTKLAKNHVLNIRRRKINVLFAETSQYILGSEGRETFFYEIFLYRKKIENCSKYPKNSQIFFFFWPHELNSNLGLW